MKKYKWIFSGMLFLSVLVAIAHVVMLFLSNSMAIGLESMILNVIPYGLPILIFYLARRGCKKRSKPWSKRGGLMMALFIVCFLVMSAHVTLAFFSAKESFVNVYFNVPILYTVPLLLLAILWAALKPDFKTRSKKKTFFNVLPWILILAMLAHCCVVSAIALCSTEVTTSAPWWVSPLLISLAYIPLIALAFLIKYAIHKRRSR